MLIRTQFAVAPARQSARVARARIVRYAPRFILSIVLGVLVAVGGACAKPQATPPPRKPYYDTAALTGTLRRGISTEDDVRRALGTPNGSGQLLLPGDPVPRDTWYYTKMALITGTSGKTFELEQDVVMVFFKAGSFDGFLWFSDAEKPS